MGYLHPARSEKKKKNYDATERLTIAGLFLRIVVGGDTFSPLVAVLGLEQKEYPCHPLPLFMAVSMILNM